MGREQKFIGSRALKQDGQETLPSGPYQAVGMGPPSPCGLPVMRD